MSYLSEKEKGISLGYKNSKRGQRSEQTVAQYSVVAGYVGIWVSIRANVRVSSVATWYAREALQIVVCLGGFSALVVVGMAVMGVAILYATLYVRLGVGSPGAIKATNCKKTFFKRATDNSALAVKEHVAYDEGVFDWNDITVMSILLTRIGYFRDLGFRVSRRLYHQPT
nr:uncharacterized protein LOC117273377 [Nicotiana tomentosiformis]